MVEKEKYIQRELQNLSHAVGRQLLSFGAVTFMALSLLDFFVTPENFTKFLIYRTTVACLLFILSFVLKFRHDQLFQSSIIILGVSLTAAAIELMILSFGGHQSVYYAGLIVALFFIVGFIPLSAKASILFVVITYSIYLFPILLFDKITNYRLFINNNTFLLAASVIGLIWRFVNYKLLIKNLSLQYALNQQNKQLEVYSKQLQGMVEDRTKELRKSEQWHRSIVDNANDGIIVLDHNGIIINVNEKACEMHGFSRDALMGAHIRLLENPDKQNETDDRMRRLLQGEALVFESMHNKKDGTPIYLEISSKAITIDNEVFIQSFYRDITEKKKLQEHVFQSQKMDSIGVLAGGIAHDFNNILTAIMGHTEIIRRGVLDEKSSHSLNVIEDASRRAGRMVSKLLGFARKSNYESVPLNMNNVIFDTVKLLERVIDRKISLTVELDHGLPLIHGDLNQIEQVIMNLIVNARDAMPNGGRIVIKTTAREVLKGMPDIPPYVPPGHYVLLSVSDTGVGIPKDVVDKIFEPFFTTKERGKGTGLGLSMVYGAIKEHKGYIAVQSTPGKGTIFTVYLPASPALNIVEEKRQMPSVSGSETALIIDDEQDILHAMQDALTSHGYKVFAISDAESAINIYKKIFSEIAIVITDIVMPRINGKELISQIKSVNPDVKILAISGYTKYVAPKDEIGEINGFLQKPFESYYLLSVVRRILDAKPHDALKN